MVWVILFNINNPFIYQIGSMVVFYSITIHATKKHSSRFSSWTNFIIDSKNQNESRNFFFGWNITLSYINNRILKGREVIPLIFPNVPLRFPNLFKEILRDFQEHPLPLNIRQNTTSARTWSRCFSTWRFLDVWQETLGGIKTNTGESNFDEKIVR